jgi:hypothetical protein
VTMTVAMTVIIMAMCVTSNMAVGMIIVRVWITSKSNSNISKSLYRIAFINDYIDSLE